MLEILQRNELQKHQELIQAKTELLKDNSEKDATISELSFKLIDSKTQFYLNQKIKLWKFLIILGKSWLFILCIALVLLTKLFDFLLSIENSIFINISSISVVFSIILKFIDKKMSSYNKGVEYWFYKKSFNNISNMIKNSEQEYCDEIISKIKENGVSQKVCWL